MNALDRHVDNFTVTLKMLTCDLVSRYPDDAMVLRAHKRVSIAVDVKPRFVVEEVGSYLMRYKKEIYGFNEDVEAFFMENTFDTELREAADREKVDLVRYIIPLVKETTRALDVKEKARYIECVVDMLDAYVEYITLLGELSMDVASDWANDRPHDHTFAAAPLENDYYNDDY